MKCVNPKSNKFFLQDSNLEISTKTSIERISNYFQFAVDSRLFEPALIRIIRLFELRSHSPWICLPNSGKNTFGYSNPSYSNFQLFEPIFIPLGANYRVNHPQLFEFLLL